MEDDEQTVKLDIEVVWSTRYAVLVSDGDKEAWLAKSLLRPLNEDKGVDDYEGKEGVGESVTLIVPEWLAMREGLV